MSETKKFDFESTRRQLHEDRKLLERIDQFGKGLTRSERSLLESFLKWTDGEQGKPLTPAQRAVAVEIDDRRVE